MKILVTGADGQLGYDVVKQLQERNISYYKLTRQEADLALHEKVEEIVMSFRPQVIIHCAAYTNVESAELNPEECRDINVGATKLLVNLSKLLDAKFVYVSTDYVFSGDKDAPYEIDDKATPLSVYGQSKLEGEIEVQNNLDNYFIVRTSWSFGIHGQNFVKKMLELAKTNREISVVNDQIGSPTYTKDLAEFIIDLVQTEKYGIYHATNEGYCTWAEFAEEIFKLQGLPIRVERIKSSEFPTLAYRPRNSQLSKNSLDKAGINRLPAWQDALQRYFIQYRNQ